MNKVNIQHYHLYLLIIVFTSCSTYKSFDLIQLKPLNDKAGIREQDSLEILKSHHAYDSLELAIRFLKGKVKFKDNNDNLYSLINTDQKSMLVNNGYRKFDWGNGYFGYLYYDILVKYDNNKSSFEAGPSLAIIPKSPNQVETSFFSSEDGKLYAVNIINSSIQIYKYDPIIDNELNIVYSLMIDTNLRPKLTGTKFLAKNNLLILTLNVTYQRSKKELNLIEKNINKANSILRHKSKLSIRSLSSTLIDNNIEIGEQSHLIKINLNNSTHSILNLPSQKDWIAGVNNDVFPLVSKNTKEVLYGNIRQNNFSWNFLNELQLTLDDMEYSNDTTNCIFFEDFKVRGFKINCKNHSIANHKFKIDILRYLLNPTTLVNYETGKLLNTTDCYKESFFHFPFKEGFVTDFNTNGQLCDTNMLPIQLDYIISSRYFNATGYVNENFSMPRKGNSLYFGDRSFVSRDETIYHSLRLNLLNNKLDTVFTTYHKKYKDSNNIYIKESINRSEFALLKNEVYFLKYTEKFCLSEPSNTSQKLFCDSLQDMAMTDVATFMKYNVNTKQKTELFKISNTRNVKSDYAVFHLMGLFPVNDSIIYYYFQYHNSKQDTYIPFVFEYNINDPNKFYKEFKHSLRGIKNIELTTIQ